MDLLQIAAALDGLPLHALLMIALVILWRDNQALRAKIDSLHEKADIQMLAIIDQKAQMARIEDKTVPITTTRQYLAEKR